MNTSTNVRKMSTSSIRISNKAKKREQLFRVATQMIEACVESNFRIPADDREEVLHDAICEFGATYNESIVLADEHYKTIVSRVWKRIQRTRIDVKQSQDEILSNLPDPKTNQPIDAYAQKRDDTSDTYPPIVESRPFEPEVLQKLCVREQTQLVVTLMLHLQYNNDEIVQATGFTKNQLSQAAKRARETLEKIFLQNPYSEVELFSSFDPHAPSVLAFFLEPYFFFSWNCDETNLPVTMILCRK